MRNNEVTGNGKIGVLFRDDARGQDFWPNRNRLEQNRIIDNGGEDGVAIDIRGRTRDLQIVSNEIHETRGAMKRLGVRIAAEVGSVNLAKNSISGFATAVLDERSMSSGT
jgi:hypothetical protein